MHNSSIGRIGSANIAASARRGVRLIVASRAILTSSSACPSFSRSMPGVSSSLRT
jgi:hypothetical protein